MTQLTGGQAVLRTLLEHGVDTVFGLPGVHNLAIFDAMLDYPEVKHIETRHEQAMAYMADGYARVTGKVGVCLSTTGPGALNTAAAMGTAFNDSSRLLTIMSQIESRLVDKHKGALHEGQDQMGTFKSLSRYTRRAAVQSEISPAIHDYFKQVYTGRPGPGAIEICHDVLRGAAEVEIIGAEAFTLPSGDIEAIASAADILAKAKFPVIWCGGGVTHSGASAEVTRLAEYLQAPVMTTTSGKGAIPDDHPLALGARTGDPSVREMMSRVDAMLAIGTRFAGNSTTNFTFPHVGKLIHIDIDPEELGRNYPPTVGIHADAKAALSRLCQLVENSRPPAEEMRRDLVRQVKKASIEGMKAQEMTALHVALLDEVRSALSREAIIVNDMSRPCYTASRYLDVYEPRTYIAPTGFGTLGTAFPTALGVKVAKPEREVICLTGDGGFQYNLQEMITAVSFGITVPVVIWNDCLYGALHGMQTNWYSGRYIGIHLQNPDFVSLAEAYGARGVRVEKISDLRGAIEQALGADTMTVIDVQMNKL